MCKVKLYELIPREESTNTDGNRINEKTNNTDNKGTYDMNENEKDDNPMDKLDVEKGMIGVKYMQMERNVCFLENVIFTVEVSILEHKRPNIKGK